MLVATIIVAAIVAAFAGGLAAETDASPNIIISGTYSQTDGLILKHLSGDSVSGVDIYVRPDQGFKSSYYKLSWNADSISESSVWNAGDTREIPAKDIQKETDGAPDSQYNSTSTKYPVESLQFEVSADSKTYYTTFVVVKENNVEIKQQSHHDGRDLNYGFNHPSAVGKTMIVELHKDGRIIASTPVKIMA